MLELLCHGNVTKNVIVTVMVLVWPLIILNIQVYREVLFCPKSSLYDLWRSTEVESVTAIWWVWLLPVNWSIHVVIVKNLVFYSQISMHLFVWFYWWIWRWDFRRQMTAEHQSFHGWILTVMTSFFFSITVSFADTYSTDGVGAASLL